MSDLLPCPFCGSAATIEESDSDWMGDMNLGCSGRKCRILPIINFRDENGGKDRAVTSWNTRISPTNNKKVKP